MKKKSPGYCFPVGKGGQETSWRHLSLRRTTCFHPGQEDETNDEEAPDGKDARALIPARGVGDAAEDERAYDGGALAAQRVEAEELRLHALGAEAREEGAARRLHRPQACAGHHWSRVNITTRLGPR